MILLSTLSTLIPYAFCSIAELVILKRKSLNFQWNEHKRLIFLSIATLIFTFAAIIGTGVKTIIYGLGLLMMAIPVYLWKKSLSKSTKN
jgi:APA family basic amino acid/polyamine antiporter